MPKYAGLELFQQTLKTELINARNMTHANIARVYERYEGARGLGISMEYIQGTELADWMKENQGRLLATAQLRLDLLRTLFDALAHAHEHTLHRDIKPQNIMLVDGDIKRPKMMDFGFALPHEDARQEGFVVGTPRYMPQEQYLEPDTVKPSADIYAMGVIAYQLFTSRDPPMTLRHTKTAEQVLALRMNLDDIPRPSQFCAVVPPALDELIVQCLAFDPEVRPQDAAQVRDALRGIELLDPESLQESVSAEGTRHSAIDIPSGTVILGSGSNVDNPNEKPARRVLLGAFAIERAPVTNEQYAAYLRATGHEAPPKIDGANQGSNHPVVGVSWSEARAYAKWKGGCLPSEAQWEYAATSSLDASETPVPVHAKPVYPWGDDAPTSVYANIDAVREGTTPVGTYPAGRSTFGLDDLCGNVWEWCEDVWSESYYRSLPTKPTEADPICTGTSEERTLRGGAYDSFAFQGRCAFRKSAVKDTRDINIGFRLVYPGDDTDTESST